VTDRPTYQRSRCQPTSRKKHATTSANKSLDAPAPGNLSSADPQVVTVADSDEEPSKVQRPQQSEDERPYAATCTVHTDHTPGSDTPTASWT
jgi:hypothetical protein